VIRKLQLTPAFAYCYDESKSDIYRYYTSTRVSEPKKASKREPRKPSYYITPFLDQGVPPDADQIYWLKTHHSCTLTRIRIQLPLRDTPSEVNDRDIKSMHDFEPTIHKLGLHQKVANIMTFNKIFEL
jgi:hypothetical protein